MKPDERIEKLPVWAQQLINRLSKSIEYFENLFNQSNTETRVFIESYEHGKIFLTENHDVTFRLKNNDEISVRYCENFIEVTSNFKGILVAPKVTNVITVKTEED